jgi:hypothetical protein
MITKDELTEVTDRKDRFELSMIYMMLHGSGTFIETLTLDDVKAIRSTVLYVCNSMDYNSQKEGTEYFNIEAGDKAYQGMLDLREKQAAEETQRRLLKEMNREADEEAVEKFRFDHMDTLNHADSLTVTQIVTEIVKTEALCRMMVGWLYKLILANEINAAKVLLDQRIRKAPKQELDVYNTFRRYGIFAKMRDDATCRIMNRDKQQLKY